MITINPAGHYSIPEAEIIEICGILPHWAMLMPNVSLRNTMELQYGYGPLIEIIGGEVTPDLTFTYPGDPPLYPLIKIQRGTETFVQYPYAVVAFLTEGKPAFVTRMD